MRVSKRQLRRLIREACGDAPAEDIAVELPPVEVVQAHLDLVTREDARPIRVDIPQRSAHRRVLLHQFILDHLPCGVDANIIYMSMNMYNMYMDMSCTCPCPCPCACI